MSSCGYFAKPVSKRSVVLVFGKNALYIRLPDQNPDAVVHRVNIANAHVDGLSERDNALRLQAQQVRDRGVFQD